MASGQLEEWGAHCSLSTCNALDFLPFKCQHCHRLYCASHYKALSRPGEGGHFCSQWDESKEDARVPSCPLCGAAVSIPKGVDPNIPMDAHLTSACSVLDSSNGFAREGTPSGQRPRKPPNTCAFDKCGTKMIVPMRCGHCGHEFCTPHRFPQDHSCKGKATASKQAMSNGNFLNDPQKRAALAAVKRRLTTVSTLAKSSTPPLGAVQTTSGSLKGPSGSRGDPIILDGAGPSSHKGAPPLPKLGLGKADRRARAEEESRRRGLETRARKGLLTEQEKVQYATELALLHGSSKQKNGECLVS